MSESRKDDIRKMLYQMAGIVPSTPALPMTGIAGIIKGQIIAQARADKPADVPDLSDDDIWDRARGATVTVEMMLSTVGPLIETLDAIEKRIAALENPKQPWET